MSETADKLRALGLAVIQTEQKAIATLANRIDKAFVQCLRINA